MYYKIYIDSIFIINFTLNLYILLLTNEKLQSRASRFRLLLGAVIGSSATCISLIIPIMLSGTINILFGILGVIIMIKIAIPYEKFRGFVRTFLCMLGFTFLIGGCLLFLYHRVLFFKQYAFSIWGVIAMAGVIYTLISKNLKREKKEDKKCVEVFFMQPDKTVSVTALIDSGNSLIEPISKQPVSLVEQEIMDILMTKEEQSYFRVVPFHSIGKEKGYLKAYKVDEILVIHNGIKKKYKNSYIAISEVLLTNSADYQMILHPKLIES